MAKRSEIGEAMFGFVLGIPVVAHGSRLIAGRWRVRAALLMFRRRSGVCWDFSRELTKDELFSEASQSRYSEAETLPLSIPRYRQS